MQLQLCQLYYMKYFSYYIRSDNDMPMQAQEGSRSIAPTHSQPDNSRRWVVSTKHGHFSPRNRSVTHYTGGWVGFGVYVDGTESIGRTGTRSPDRPASIESYTDYDNKDAFSYYVLH
jgi:hypothetical protein